MGCNCSKNSRVRWRVTFGNGAPAQTYTTPEEARQAIRDAGSPAGSSFTAVPA